MQVLMSFVCNHRLVMLVFFYKFFCFIYQISNVTWRIEAFQFKKPITANSVITILMPIRSWVFVNPRLGSNTWLNWISTISKLCITKVMTTGETKVTFACLTMFVEGKYWRLAVVTTKEWLNKQL
jgi:hypothetical protein